MTPALIRFNHLGLLLLIILLSGCQALQSQEPLDADQVHQALVEQQQAIQKERQAEVKALEASLEELEKRLSQQFKQQLSGLQDENRQFHHQHTFQLEELSHQLAGTSGTAEPGFNSESSPDVVNNEGLLVFGRYEWVGFPDKGFVISARVDSGANTSSMHAINISELEKDGETWIRFTTQYQADGEDEVKDIKIEAPLVRRVTIRQASGSESRPVVKLRMQLGSKVSDTEFTLTDRGDMSHPALLGRRFMKDIALIDVAEQYLQPKPEIEASTDESSASEADPSPSDGKEES